MPKLEYFLVCESVSIDRETNRVSIFHVVEEFRPVERSEPGFVVAQLVALCCWNSESNDSAKDFQATLRLHPTGDKPHEFAMNFQMKGRRQRLLFQLQGIPPLRPGELKFELLLNGEHQAEHVVTVHPAKVDASQENETRAG